MKNLKKQSGCAVTLAASTIMSTACTLTATEEIDALWQCQAFVPITWSSKDTETTVRQVLEHNAVWHALCTKPAPQ